MLGLVVQGGVVGEARLARCVAAEMEMKGSEESRGIYEKYIRACGRVRAWVEYRTVAGRDLWERGAQKLRERAVEQVEK